MQARAGEEYSQLGDVRPLASHGASHRVLVTHQKPTTALARGRVTVDDVLTKSPGLGIKKAKQQVTLLDAAYDEANARGYRLLVKKIDLKKRPALASKILRELEPTEDGHGLWNEVCGSCDFSSPEKQDSRETKLLN